MDFSKINLADNQVLAREIIERAAGKNFKNRSQFEKFRNGIIKQHRGRIFHNLYFIKAYNDLVKEGRIVLNDSLLGLIQKRSVRTMSGVAPVTVLTKPYPCPGRCIYCPTDARMPKSYLPSQPAAQRAFRQGFDPYTQVFVRLKALVMTGHEISKVELRVIGGSWSAYPKKYQIWFLKRCLMAMNEFHYQIGQGRADDMAKITKKRKIESKYGTDIVNTVFIKSLSKNVSFGEAVSKNEMAKVRCIGINVETRPDLIDEKEVKRMRQLGVTKVEMGVQTTSDRIYALTRRGHKISDVRNATCLLKDAGFKVGYHMMPNLPGSTVKFDKKMVGELFGNPDFQPDYLKIYPCVVMPRTVLSQMYRRGEYKSYDEAELEEVLMEEMKAVPEWCRIDRIARDIPSNEVESGFRVSNIRQILEERLRKEGSACRDIRSREVRGAVVDPENVRLVTREYEASGGKEVFLSYEDVKNDRLVALLRLRFPGRIFISELKNSALVREIHVYGRQIPVGGSVEKGSRQHMGWGSRLMAEAERLAKAGGYKRLAVISGIGTREYYSKKGYELEGTYMVKGL
ncbi:MAG: tRNA uridine(34) 5-carboxymethylaminomethyl modification radical SAM/GNAT enzyme Elp3 [Candidatus Peregrinibacteria bacterium]